MIELSLAMEREEGYLDSGLEELLGEGTDTYIAEQTGGGGGGTKFI